MPTQAEVDLHDPLLPLRVSAEVALLEQELAIRDAVNRALEQWLPIAEKAVLDGTITAAVGPNPDGLTMAADLWTHAVEGELQPTIGAVFTTGARTAKPDLMNLDLLPIAEMRDEYWANVVNRITGLPAELHDRLQVRLNSALDAGTSTAGLADIVKSVLSIAELKNDVTRIARTEATGAFNAGTLGAWQQSAKLTGEETDKVWIATRDLRTRHDHRAADEQRVDLFAPFIVGGFPMPFPGWPAAPPSEVINCRCSMIELLKGEPMPDVKRKSWSQVDADSQPTSRPAPVPPKQTQQMTELIDHVHRWQKDLTGLDSLLAAVDSGYRPEDVDTLAGYETNPDRWVARIRHGNGTTLIHKRASVEDVEKEQLSSILGRQMGVPVAKVLRIQDDEFVSELVPGEAAAEYAERAVPGVDVSAKLGYEAAASASRQFKNEVGDGSIGGLRLSMFDVLIDESDRHLWDVHVDQNGSVLGAFDQEFAWTIDDPDFVRPDKTLNRFAQWIGSSWFDMPDVYDVNDPNAHWGTWKTNPLTKADVAWLRIQLDAVRPQFRQLGHDDWWQFSKGRLKQLAKHAGGTKNVFAPEGFVADGAEFHLPGRHDQLDHGRWARYGTKAFNRRGAEVAAVGDDPERGVFPLSQGIQARVQREVGKNGKQVVRKTFPAGSEYGGADREELAARVMNAVGLEAPAIHRVNENEVLMEYVEGQTGAEAFTFGPGFAVTGSPDGRLLGLVDAVIRNGDRNASNWKLRPDGRIGPIDGGLAFASAGPTKPFGSYIVDQGADLGQVRMVRQKVKQLRPEFERLDRMSWYDQTLKALDETELHSISVQASAVFHLPHEHDQRSHGRRGLPPLDLDEHGIPVGFDASGAKGDGWDDASEGEIAEFAQAAHRAGFTSMRFDPTIGGAIGAVHSGKPDELMLDTRMSWDLERFDKIAKSLGPYSTEQTFWMTESHDNSPTSYLIDHEAGHRVAFTNGQQADGYLRMKDTIVSVAKELGLEVGPVEMAEDPRGNAIMYVDADGPKRELITSDMRDHFVSGEVQRVLAKMGASFKATSGGMAELYAELYAAHLAGNESRLVQAVAAAEGWSHGEV